MVSRSILVICQETFTLTLQLRGWLKFQLPSLQDIFLKGIPTRIKYRQVLNKPKTIINNNNNNNLFLVIL
jgi:hypothetical protein